MSAKDPNGAEFELPVEHPILRRMATFTRENQLLSGLLIAGFGATFSIGSLVLPPLVIPDIAIDVIAAFLSVTFIRRVVTVTAESVETEASPSVGETTTEPADQEGNTENDDGSTDL